MPSRPTSRTILKLALAGGLAVAGLASAQPAPPPETAPKAPSEVVMPPAAPPAEAKPPAPPVAAEKEAAPPAPAVEAKPVAPAHRSRYDVAVIEALDKVTAESLRFEAVVNRPVRYKSLIFTVKACERSAPDEPIDDSIAYVTVDSQPRPQPGKPPLAPRQAFKGWMYASSPGLHPLEHPVYDAWLITCRAAAPPSAPAR